MVCHKFCSSLCFVAIKSSVNLRKVLSIYIQKDIVGRDINNSHAVKGSLYLYILISHRNFYIKLSRNMNSLGNVSLYFFREHFFNKILNRNTVHPLKSSGAIEITTRINEP